MVLKSGLYVISSKLNRLLVGRNLFENLSLDPKEVVNVSPNVDVPIVSSFESIGGE